MLSQIHLHKVQVPLRRELGLRINQVKTGLCRVQAIAHTSVKLNGLRAMKATVLILVILPEIALSHLIMPSRRKTSRPCGKGEPGQANLQICIPLTSNIHVPNPMTYCWNSTWKTTVLSASNGGFRLIQKQHWPSCGILREAAHAQ